jgi:hypothetical protein
VSLATYHLAALPGRYWDRAQRAWNQNLFGGQPLGFPQTFATHSQRGGVSSGLWPGETF